MIFVDSKLTLTCLLTHHQLVTVFVHHTQVISLIWRVLHLSVQMSEANGAHDTINYFACNFAGCSPILKILTDKLNDKFVMKQPITTKMLGCGTL